MAKRSKAVNTDDQPSLFQSNENNTIPDTARTYHQLDKVNREEKRKRNSFTSKEEYYQSPEWQSKRQQKLRQAKHKCQVCGKVGNLDIHHIHYDNLYDEHMEDLQALCRYHHVIADGDREYDSGFDTFVYKRHGDNAWNADLESEGELFDKWLEGKEEGW